MGERDGTAFVPVETRARSQVGVESLRLGKLHQSLRGRQPRRGRAQLGVPAEHLTRADRSFEFVVNSPRTTWFLKRAAGIAKGANFPKRETCGRLSVKALYEIAKVKQADANLKDLPLEKICRSIVGTAKSMGLEIYDPRNV